MGAVWGVVCGEVRGTCVLCVVRCLEGVEDEWWAVLGVGCGWVL
jgi:hypothetical protein